MPTWATALIATLTPLFYLFVALTAGRYIYRNVQVDVRNYDEDDGHIYWTRERMDGSEAFMLSLVWPLSGLIWLSYKYVTAPPRKKGVEKSEAELEAVNADLAELGIEK